MARANDNPMVEYIEHVTSLPILSKAGDRELVLELIEVLFDSGFLIHNCEFGISGCPRICWGGKCYDEDLVWYTYQAEYLFNDITFREEPYRSPYDLITVDVEPYEGE